MQKYTRFLSWVLIWCLFLSLSSFADILDNRIYFLDSSDIVMNADIEDIPYNDNGEAVSDELQSNQDNPVSNAENVSIQAQAVYLANEATNFAVDGAPLSGAWWLCSFNGYSNVYVYVPLANANDSFSWNSNGVPINITGSSITGYIGGQDYDQSIQFPPFSTPRYRRNSNYDYTYITTFSATESTIKVYGSKNSENNFLDFLTIKDWQIITVYILIASFVLLVLGRFFN